MEIKRKTFIEIETRRVFFAAAPPSTFAAVFCSFCPATEKQRRMLTPEAAADVFKVSRRAIYRFIEQDAAHFVETADGEIFVCPAALAESLEKKSNEKN